MKKDEKKSRMVNFRLSETEYESFKDNVLKACGSDNGAVSRYLRQRIFTETYDIRLLRSLCSDMASMKADLDHELKLAAAAEDTRALQSFLESNIKLLVNCSEKLSKAIAAAEKES